jgi:predicted ATPase/class 3 adenylate cyclase
MAELPAGTVTFLFTDVEGSTRMVRELGDRQWAALLDTHRELVRSAVRDHDGHEFGTQGDALFAVFAKATDACAAAVTAQRAVEGHDWSEGSRVRVRLGLNSGEAIAHGDNYVGKEVHRASRICDAAHGGQILLSERTAALVRESLSAGYALTGLGEHRLKDMGGAERLFQLSAPDLPQEFERLRSLDSPSNLSAPRSSFVGRDKEIAVVRELLENGRLVSLTGIGGSGKTRIATEVGSLELARFVDGVYFVDLAPVSDPDLIAQVTASACVQAIGDVMRGDVGGSEEDRLVTALTQRMCLLIVDNCEHLIDAAADLLDRILAGCPNVTVLVTSREALGIDGEQIVAVPSLTVPRDATDVETVDHSDAVRLFVERAKSVKPAFALAADNREAVVEICRRLDGIPLAIELAATPIAHLSVQQIADRLEDRFRLLTGGRRRIQRQQTLGAAMDWSHELLSELERTLLRRLSVFAGGFTLEAAEAVATGDDIPDSSALEILGSLVAKSLVVANEDGGGETRYQLLETVRIYTADKLAEAGEAEAQRTRHRDWYFAWLEQIPAERLSASMATLDETAKEIDNLRAAADWSISLDEPGPVARFAVHLYAYWGSGAHEEGMRWLSTALKHEERLSVEERIGCYATIVGLAGTTLDREDACTLATRAIELAAGQRSRHLVLAHGFRGFFKSINASAAGMPESLAADARRDCREAIDIAGRGLDSEWLIRAKALSGAAEETLGDHHATAAEYDQILAILGDDGDGHEVFWQAISALAVSHHLLGETEAALDVAMKGLDRAVSSTFSEGYMGFYRAELTPALVAGGYDEVACEVLRDQIERVRRPGIPLAENHALGLAAVVEHLRGRSDRAGRLFAASRSLGGARGMEIPFRTPGSVTLYRHYLPLVPEALGRDEARLARDEGQAMIRHVAFDYALEGLEN